jgi:hypothetical protein
VGLCTFWPGGMVEGGAWQRAPFVSTRTVPVYLPRGSFVGSFRLLLDHEPPALFLRQIEPGHGGMRTVKLYIDLSQGRWPIGGIPTDCNISSFVVNRRNAHYLFRFPAS